MSKQVTDNALIDDVAGTWIDCGGSAVSFAFEWERIRDRIKELETKGAGDD